MTAEVLKDLRWRLTDIRDMLVRDVSGNGSIYGIDEWSTPALNLKSAINRIDAADKFVDETLAERDRLKAANSELAEALELIAGTDAIDAALDPQRAIRVARAALTKHQGVTA